MYTYVTKGFTNFKVAVTNSDVFNHEYYDNQELQRGDNVGWKGFVDLLSNALKSREASSIAEEMATLARAVAGSIPNLLLSGPIVLSVLAVIKPTDEDTVYFSWIEVVTEVGVIYNGDLYFKDTSTLYERIYTVNAENLKDNAEFYSSNLEQATVEDFVAFFKTTL
ncbi:hypothetical protein BGZ72_001131 [Mortierella alpina]|nr:hypothetical protein BGZ72_001131 [Mortierella alpina]